MADVKWIKIVTDVFDDEKILMIETMPECDTIIVIWFKLLCLAGKQNNNGVFQMGKIPYSDEMFAAIFRRPINTVRLALNTFERFGMIEIVCDTVTIPNWGKHQSLDAYEKKKQRDRERIARKREEQKALITMSPDTSPDTSHDVAISEGEEELDKRYKTIDNSVPQPKCSDIVDLYNSICVSLPKVRSLSDARRKAIKARLNTYTIDDFKTVFENAEASSFLKGKNNNNWTATFDWLIADKNMAKVLDGNYADKTAKTEQKPSWMQNKAADPIALESVRRLMSEPDEDITEQAEQLKQKMQLKYGGAKNG